MARLARLAVDGRLHLLMQRALPGRAVFEDAEDAAFYLQLLREVASAERVAIHAYVLLPNEVRLLATPQLASALGRLFQGVGRRFVPMHNQRHGRAGALWEGRFRAAVVDPAEHFLHCLVFVETAPVVAGIAPRAEEHPWSSAASHVGMKVDALVSEHASLWALGNTPFEREAHCRRLLEQTLPPVLASRIERAVTRGWALGDDAFALSLSTHTERSLQPQAHGRPRKPSRPAI